MANPFNKENFQLTHYENLKADLENSSENIAISLPLFVRSYLTDDAGGWIAEFNKYDLINPIFIHSDYSEFVEVSKNVKVSNFIIPDTTHRQAILERDFLNCKIINLNNAMFSINNFISSIAYNGVLHNKPNKTNLNLIELYDNFIQKYPEIAFKLVTEIAQCFVDSYSGLYEFFKDHKSDFYSSDRNRQPKIIINGEFVKPNGQMMTFFENSYIQMPVKNKSNHGIRICCELTLIKSQTGFIFQYGHSKKSKVKISCRIDIDFIYVELLSKFSQLQKSIRIPILDKYSESKFWIEVSLYNDGAFIASIDTWVKGIEKIACNFTIENSKLIFGSNLQGKESANFYLGAVAIESINKLNVTHIISCFASRRLNPSNGHVLPPNLIERPINV